MNATESRVLPDAAAAYVAEVREALADLPDDELAEIIEDLTAHVELVIAEMGGSISRRSLSERLGDATAYAAELRFAAGLPEKSRRRLRLNARRLARWATSWAVRVAVLALVVAVAMAVFGSDDDVQVGFAAFVAVVAMAVAMATWLPVSGARHDIRRAWSELPDAPRVRAVVRRVGSTTTGREVIDGAKSLRPVWWVLRAWVAAQVLSGAGAAFPLPDTAMGVPLFLALLAASVWLGRRQLSSPAAGWQRTSQLAVNGLLVALMPFVIVYTAKQMQYVPYDDPEPYEYYGWTNEYGEPVTNVFPYGPEGDLLEGVRLYDQNGLPIGVEPLDEAEECIYQLGYGSEGPKYNEFPRPQLTVEYDEYADHGEYEEYGCTVGEIMAPFPSGQSDDIE